MRLFKTRNKDLYAELQKLKSDAPAEKSVATVKTDAQKGEFRQETAYNAKSDFEFVVKHGSRLGCHFLLELNNYADLKSCGLKTDFFRYRLAFQMSVDDSRLMFSNKIASTLPEHICQFDDGLERYSFRPYLHAGIGWDGWSVVDGTVISPYGEDGE